MIGAAVGPDPSPGWYPDPWGSGGQRWWNGLEWGAEVAPPTPPRKRHTGLIVGLVLGGVGLLCLIAIGGLLLFGLGKALDEQDNYSQDLVNDQRYFLPVDEGAWATSFAEDGFRMEVRRQHTWAATGLHIGSTHTALTIEIAVTPVTAAEGSEVGPACLSTPGEGYAFLVAGDGRAELVEFAITDDGLWDDGSVHTIVRTTVDPTVAAGERLMISCAIPAPGSDVELSGYVDGVKVISGRPRMNVSGFELEGMMGHTTDAAPAVWAFTSIERRGVHDMPE